MKKEDKSHQGFDGKQKKRQVRKPEKLEGIEVKECVGENGEKRKKTNLATLNPRQ